MSSVKYPVCIHIFPTLDYIELIQLNDQTGEIEKASSLPCPFDQANRQLGSAEALVSVIRDLYNANKIPFNTPSLLVLPSFFTREIELPSEFSKDELRFALVSEAERFYLFKKSEPHIDWLQLDESRLLYSAYPKAEIEKYMQAFQELRIPLLAIELNYFSILRGLVATGTISDEIDLNRRWSLMVISDNTFFVGINEGVKIQKVMDAPLSVSAEDDSTLTEIQQDFESFVALESFDKLIVVNNSKDISTDRLVNQLQYQGQLIIVEQNEATLRSRGSMEAQFPCSLEAIGGVFYQEFNELPSMNFKIDTAQDVVAIMDLREKLLKIMLAVDFAVFILILMMWGGLQLLVMMKEDEVKNIKYESSGPYNPNEQMELQRKLFVKKAAEMNEKTNDLVVKLGTLIKDDVWLEKVTIKTDALAQKQDVLVEGRSLKPDPIDGIRNQLNQSLKREDLAVDKLERASSDDGQEQYVWTILTKTADAATAAPPPGGG